LISHKHQCIFIHVPKAAGKSVLALFGLPELGRDYVNRLPYIEDPFDHIPVLKYVGRPFFKSYFKFGVVRNPWDRLVSAFSYLAAGGCNRFDADYRDRYLSRYAGSFSAFVPDLPHFIAHKHFAPQYLFLCDPGGSLLVDEVIRYEQLDLSMERVRQRLALEGAPLPHRNPSNHRPYAEYYTASTWKLVADLYAHDLESFGYPRDFGNASSQVHGDATR
jgi:hypothetical protein